MTRVLLTISMLTFLWVLADFTLAEDTGQEADGETSAVLQEAQELIDHLTSGENDQTSPLQSAELSLKYEEWLIRYWQKTYEWHFTSSILILFVVAAVVVAGVGLAWWQLRSWLERAKEYDEVILNVLTGKSDNVTDITKLLTTIAQPDGGKLNFTRKSLSVSSPYVGVVILGLSLAFFIAYLYFVFPIKAGPSL